MHWVLHVFVLAQVYISIGLHSGSKVESNAISPMLQITFYLLMIENNYNDNFTAGKALWV